MQHLFHKGWKVLCSVQKACRRTPNVAGAWGTLAHQPHELLRVEQVKESFWKVTALQYLAPKDVCKVCTKSSQKIRRPLSLWSHNVNFYLEHWHLRYEFFWQKFPCYFDCPLWATYSTRHHGTIEQGTYPLLRQCSNEQASYILVVFSDEINNPMLEKRSPISVTNGVV